MSQVYYQAMANPRGNDGYMERLDKFDEYVQRQNKLENWNLVHQDKFEASFYYTPMRSLIGWLTKAPKNPARLVTIFMDDDGNIVENI